MYNIGQGMMFLVTLRCNLSCPRCFVRHRPHTARREDMTWEQFTHTVDRCAELGLHVKWLQFSGGEATLWPHLRDAVRYVKAAGICDRVRITSNGVDRNLSDYGGADLISISHYGAVNRADMARLRRQAKTSKQRVDIGYVVHLPWPWPDLDQIPLDARMPAACSCVLYAFIQDQVYPCSFSAIVNPNHHHCHVDEDFPKLLAARDPRSQPLCAGCLSNRKLRHAYGENLTFEAGVWDSPVSVLHSFHYRGRLLRYLHRAYRRWRSDHLWRCRHDELHAEEDVAIKESTT